MGYKHDYDKILTRLTMILARLNDGESLSVKELSEEFNVSSKTIQRDFNERLSAFHIYQDKRKWKMQDGFSIEKTKSLQEQLVLDIIEKITEGIGGKFATTSHKLLSKIKNEDFNPIYTKLNIEDISDKFNEIQVIEKAIKDKTELECSYENEREGVFKATIQPLKIVNYEGFWYLVAFRDERIQKYYIKTLSNIQPTTQTFETDDEIEELLENSINIWFKADIEPFKVRIYADKIATKYFKRRALPTQTIETLSQDGTMEFNVKITDEMEIIPIIKYWIPHLRVLEPEWINDIIDEELKIYFNNRELNSDRS
ncbi:helix-turn-helix transcriptional regulator [Candidatus Sulfurimonas baltica]|uniref:WYL domain-containing transcriptional regulator n=1 Tax=Candidatus Sulfurimonas baltica TaxID=2740404 RepID=A0A7S7LX35_9BACT|nr:WYL domain-containing transcriptional regulator [Candidatus Sulfurimonas baltica]QOY53027.1 WYL domain-containing transcriptional regulator [Candidatus Sulfurimonas baltica]